MKSFQLGEVAARAHISGVISMIPEQIRCERFWPQAAFDHFGLLQPTPGAGASLPIRVVVTARSNVLLPPTPRDTGGPGSEPDGLVSRRVAAAASGESPLWLRAG